MSLSLVTAMGAIRQFSQEVGSCGFINDRFNRQKEKQTLSVASYEVHTQVNAKGN
jgi:hypothetical protein